MKTYMRKIRHHFKEVMKTKTSPHSIALGFAVGTLIGTLPIPFIDIFIGLIIIGIFERISKLSLIGAILLWNPLTKIPIYTLSYRVGDMIFSSEPIMRFKFLFFNQVYDYSRRFLVGNLILSVGISLASYFIVYGITWLIEKDMIGKIKNH